MASSILRCWAAASRSGILVSRKAIRRSYEGRSPMSTVAERISSAAAAPMLMLPPSFEEGGKMFYRLYSPADKKVTSVRKRSSIGEEEIKLESEREAVVVGSSHGWVALYKGMYNLDLYLYNPISHRHIKLPPVETIPVAEEGLRYCWGRPLKVILSCSPDDEEECRVILCFGPRSNLALCCPGRSTEWIPFGDHFLENSELNEFLQKPRIVRAYEDFVYSAREKQLFCVTEYAEFEAWDIGDPLSPKLNWKDIDDDMDVDEDNYPWPEDALKDACREMKYLVFSEHSNQLLLVRRYVMEKMESDGSSVKEIYCGHIKDAPYKTVGFDVHEIDREKGELRYMDGTLNGAALFIGSVGQGFVVESPEKMNLVPDSIYFTDPMECTPPYWDEYRAYGGHDLGIFHYENRTFSPCYYPCDIKKVTRIQPAPMWFTPSPSLD